MPRLTTATPWGDITLADAHAHLFGHSFFSKLASQQSPSAPSSVTDLTAQLDWEAPSPSNAVFAERWVRELDEKGVSEIVMMASLPGDVQSAADFVASRPDRFIGYFMVNPLADGATGLARHAVEQQGLRGICLFPAMHRYSVNEAAVRPFFELAAANPGTVVFVHMGILSVGVRKKLKLPSLFDLRFSNPVDLHALALEFSSVPIVVPHFGAGYFRETLILGSLASNVHVDTSSSNAWMGLQAPPLSLEQVFRQSLDIFGPERLLFGSDSSFFPRGWNRQVLDSQLPVLERIGVSRDEAAAILGGNLRRLVRMV